MADERLGRDANRVPVIGGVTDDSDKFIKALRVDPTSLRLKVTSTTTLSNIEYDEGNTDDTITGIAMMWEDTSNTLRAISAAKPLPVSEQGDFMLGTDFSNVLGSASLISGTPAVKVEEQGVATNFEGAPVTVGTSAVALTFAGTTIAVSIQSDPDNTGKVWVGKSNVTNAGGNAMKELLPGQSFDFDYNDNSNAVYAISDTASQNVFKFATL